MFTKYFGRLCFFVAQYAFTFSFAQAGGYASVKAGFGGIDVNDEFAINQVADEEETFSTGVFAGYNFDSGLVVEGGLAAEISEDIFESYDVSQIIGLVGYTFRPATDIAIVPKFGISMWELVTFESGLFNFFGGDEERTYDGTDSIFSLEGEYSLNKLIQFNLSYTLGNYDFGDLDSLRFGVEFDF